VHYIALDIETTGLEPKLHDIIEFGAVFDDLANPLPLDQLPRFHAYIKKSVYRGDPYALSMHPAIFKKIAKPGDGDNVIPLSGLMWSLVNWLDKIHYPFNEKKKRYEVNVAGKNAAGFDIPFLKEHIPGRWPDEKNYHEVYFKHRVIDPSILYFDPSKDDGLPDTKTCLERAGLGGESPHTAVEDALLVVQLVRKKLGR
jgi:DNA polymerase III epsilon subunit-like protein